MAVCSLFSAMMDLPYIDMTCIHVINLGHSARAAAWLAVAISSFASERAAGACGVHPNLHNEVTTKFDAAPTRSDYTLAAIAALARQRHQDSGGELLGLYTSAFGYTVDLATNDGQACPQHIEVVVTLRLQQRLIEIAQEIAGNSCLYPAALRHYRRLAEVDERTVERFGERAAAMLGQDSPAIQQIHPPQTKDLDAALRDHIHAVVDKALSPLHDARQDAQQAVNNSDELKHRQLERSCSI